MSDFAPAGLGRRATASIWAVLAIAVGGAIGGLAGLRGSAGLAVAVGLVMAAAIAWVSLRSPLRALALALVALPLDIFGRVTERPVPITVYQLTLLLALAAWAIDMWRHRSLSLRPSAVDAGMLMVVAAGLWSLPHSLAPNATALGIVRLCFIWAFVLLIENVPKSRRDVRMLIGLVGVVAAVHGLLGLVQYLAPGLAIGNVHVQGPQDYRALRRASGLFDDPNYFAGMLSAGLLCAGALALHSKRWRSAVAWALVSLVCAAGIVVTFSRTAWLATAVGAVILALTAPRKVRLWVVGIGLGVVVAAVVVAPGAVSQRLLSVVDVQGDQSVATRVYMARSSVEMIKDNLVWGTGLAAFDQSYPYYREIGSSRTIIRPHQIPLGLVAETGVAGLLAEVVLLGALAFVFAARPRGPLWLGEAVALAGLACMLVQSVFQYYLYFEYLWIFVGLAVVATRVDRPGEEAS